MFIFWVQLTCLTLLPRVGDAIAMAGLAGVPQPKPREHIGLQVKMDIAGLLLNMAGLGKGNEARTYSRIKERNSGHVLPWLR